LIVAASGERLEVRLRHPASWLYRIAPTKPYREAMGERGRDVWLDFTDRGDRPRITMITNHSEFRGWGTVLVESLMTAYPGVTAWPSTAVRPDGVRFWIAMRKRYGVTLIGFDEETGLLKLTKRGEVHDERARAARTRGVDDLDALVRTPAVPTSRAGLARWWRPARSRSTGR